MRALQNTSAYCMWAVDWEPLLFSNWRLRQLWQWVADVCTVARNVTSLLSLLLYLHQSASLVTGPCWCALVTWFMWYLRMFCDTYLLSVELRFLKMEGRGSKPNILHKQARKLCIKYFKHGFQQSDKAIHWAKVTGLLTGHCHLRGHLFKLVKINSPTYRRCHHETEMALHVLCDCEAVAELWFCHLGR
jgi:hypothetical protein